MELFLNYAQNSKVDLYELQKDIDRLINAIPIFYIGLLMNITH